MIYKNKYCVLNTLHSKSEVIAPTFMNELGIKVIEERGDTDQLGTFSGEVERLGTMLEVLKKKCEMGMELSGIKLGIASEGAFGPHPMSQILVCDCEMLIFIDKENDFFVFETIISDNTNYNSKVLKEEKEFLSFAKIIKFPSHGIILRPLDGDDKSIIFKGIRKLKEFHEAFKIWRHLTKDR